MDWLFRFYGVDWVIFILLSVHIWMLGNRMKSAFLMGIAASVFGCIFGLIIESAATLIMNFSFCLMHINSYVKWHQYEKNVFKED